MSPVQIGVIVEGHGEVEAVPVLIRRIAGIIDPALVPEIYGPIRINASKLRTSGELERAVDLVARGIESPAGILVLLDCDWGGACPAVDGPTLLERSRAVRPDMHHSVVLARMEFESWFLAAAESLAGKRGLPVELNAPPSPESIRGAKEWLSERMEPGRIYTPTEHQAAFTAIFDLSLARKRADSFDKCFREIDLMLRTLSQSGPER